MTAIGTVGSPSPSPSPVLSSSTAASRAQLRQAAQQFEAILLRQVLAEARKADFGGTPFSASGSGSGGSGSGGSGGGLGTFREMMDARFADIAAQTGSLGLGKVIEAQLARLVPGTDQGGDTMRGDRS